MAKFSVAINASWKDSHGVWQPKTEWVNVIAWGKLADQVSEEIGVNTPVLVVGSGETRKYEKDGQTAYSTSCKANKILVAAVKTESASDDLDMKFNAKIPEIMMDEEVPF
jgi:single-strand DNA-binding protein